MWGLTILLGRVYFPTFNFGLGHETCFDQQDTSECDMRRVLKCASTIGLGLFTWHLRDNMLWVAHWSKEDESDMGQLDPICNSEAGPATLRLDQLI